MACSRLPADPVENDALYERRYSGRLWAALICFVTLFSSMLDFLFKNFRWIFGGFVLTLFSSFGQTFFIAGSIGEWRTEFALSHGDIGRLYMLATLASALCLPFIGKLVDVFPEYMAVAVTVPALAAATLLAAYAPTISMLFFAIFLLRLFGQGMMTHIALTATGRWFDAERGRAVSLVTLGHQAGESTLPILFSSIAAYTSFRMGWMAGASALLLFCLPFGIWAYRRPREPQPSMPGSRSKSQRDGKVPRSLTRGEVLKDPCFYWLLVGVLAPPFIGTTIFYHQDHLTELHEWPETLFARSMIVMAATTVLFALASGFLIDLYGAVKILPLFLLPMTVTCGLLATLDGVWQLYGAMLFLGVSYGVSATLLGAVWPEVYGVDHLGSVRSMVVAVMVFATAAGPGITGTLIDWGITLATQFAFLSGYCVLATIAMGGVSKRLLARRTADD